MHDRVQRHVLQQLAEARLGLQEAVHQAAPVADLVDELRKDIGSSVSYPDRESVLFAKLIIKKCLVLSFLILLELPYNKCSGTLALTP